MNEILMYGTVGYEITGAEVIRQLADMPGDVTVRINSYGGDSFEGVAVMNALRHHDGEITAVVEGVAASAASVIAVGGASRLVMRPGSELMIHDAWTFADGNAADLEKIASDLERTSQSVAEIYAEKAGGDVDEWREMMRAETWFSAREAVEAGLADAVEDGRTAELPVLAKVGPRFAYAGRGRAPRPKILEEESMDFANEVAQRLGLVAVDVDEDTVLAALEEALAEQAEEPAETAEASEVAEVVPAVGGEAAVPAEAEQEQAEEQALEVDSEEAPEVEAETEEPAPAGVVTLDVDTYAELVARAEAGAKAHEEAEAKARAEEVAGWVAEGRISAAVKPKALALAEQDMAAARALYGANPKNTIPRVEVGYGVDDEPESTPARGADPFSPVRY